MMLCKTLATTVNLFATLLCFVAILSTAAPLARRAGTLAERDSLVPVVPGTPIQPPLVDLLDQFQNLQQQFDAASPDDPDFDALSKQLKDTKSSLDQAIKGVAVLSTSSAPASSDSATPTPNSSVTSTATSTTAGSASTTSPPSTSVITDVPIVTVVTQVGTSIVVIASQGVTSTVTLATITTVQSGPVSSPTSAVPTSKSSASVAGSSKPSNSNGSTTATATTAATTGKIGNAAVGQGTGSGAIAIAPKSIATVMLGGSLLGVMMVVF